MLILNLSIFEYLDKIPLWKEIKEGIFSKALDWQPYFLFQLNILKNPSCPNKRYNAIFKHIHDNVRVYSWTKKTCIDQWLRKKCILGRTQARRGMANKFGLFQLQLRGVGGVKIPGTFCNFYPHFSLETVFPGLKLTQSFYINMKFSFSWKLAT